MKYSDEMLIDEKFRLTITIEKIPHSNYYHNNVEIIEKVIPWIRTALQRLLLKTDEPIEPIIIEMKRCVRQSKHEHTSIENIICDYRETHLTNS